MKRWDRIASCLAATVVGGMLAADAAAGEDLDRALAAIKSIDREGKKNDTAGVAWKALVAEGGAALLPTLAAIDDARPTPANWLRTAVDAIVEAERKAKRPLPVKQLEAFTVDQKNAPSARRLSYELLIAEDPAAKARLLPGFLNDRNPDLRRDAVSAGLDALKAAPSTPALKSLFAAARDKDQVEEIAKRLTAKKVAVSIPEHYGFVTHFRLIGPFDSEKGKALTLAYAPEKSADAKAAYKGKANAEVAWKPATASDPYASFDLNKLLGKSMNAAAYAHAVVISAADQPCEVRAASPNAVQIFLNGEKLFEREEYHHGSSLDYHVGRGKLRKGPNALLIKVCQNNQTDTWAQDWKFQARVCDATGGPLPGLTQLVPDVNPTTPVKLGTVPATAAKPEEKK